MVPRGKGQSTVPGMRARGILLKGRWWETWCSAERLGSRGGVCRGTAVRCHSGHEEGRCGTHPWITVLTDAYRARGLMSVPRTSDVETSE